MKRCMVLTLSLLLSLQSFGLLAAKKRGSSKSHHYGDKARLLKEQDAKSKAQRQAAKNKQDRLRQKYRTTHPCQGSQSFHGPKSSRPAYRGEGNSKHMGPSWCQRHALRQVRGDEKTLKACEEEVLAGALGEPVTYGDDCQLFLEEAEEGSAVAFSRSEGKLRKQIKKLREKLAQEREALDEKEGNDLETSAERANIRAFQQRIERLEQKLDK